MKKPNLKFNIGNSLFLILILYSAFFILNSNQSVINKLKIEIQALFGREVKAQADITTGLVGHWKFDESSGTTASDSSGNNNTGTLVNGPLWITGKIGGALSFDKIDDSVNIESVASLNNLSAITVSAWIYPLTKGESGAGNFISKRGNLSGWMFGFFSALPESNTRLGFFADYDNNGRRTYLQSYKDNAIFLNTWHHLVATWDGSSQAVNIHIYIDGTEAIYSGLTNAVGMRKDDSLNSLIIGNNAPKNSTFDGSIDEVRIYNRVLSSTEVQELYNYTGMPPPPDTTPPVLSSGSPTGALPSGTTQTTLSLATDENATCKYGTIPNTAYASIADTFTTTGGTSHSGNLTGLANGTSYNYYIRCQDTAGNVNTTDYTISFSVSSPVVPDTQAPSVPIGLSATAVSSSQINLSWTASTDNTAVTGYKIYRCTGSACAPTVQIATSAINSYSNTGLTASTAYTYAVSAYDAAGNESVQSVPVSATTQSPLSSCDTSIGNTAICPKPYPAPTLPAAGGSYIDPTYGTKIIRVTDENDGISAQALYSYWSPFNKDSSLFVAQIQLQTNTTRLFLYGFDKITETISKIRMLPLLPVPLQGGIHWSSQSLNIFYGLGGIKLYQYDTNTNINTPLKDFTSICPSTSCSTWQLSKSYEDRYFAFTLKDVTQNYKDIKVVVWDKNLDQTYVLDIDTYFTYYDESRLDQSGKWLYMAGTSKAGVPKQRGLFWEFSTGTILTAPNYIGHYGTDFAGVVGTEGTVDPNNKPGIRRTDLNDFNLGKDVFYFPKKGTRSNWQISDHISVLPALSNNPPYAFIGSYTGIKLTGFILDSGFIYKKANASTSASTVSFPPEAMSQNGHELTKVNVMPTGAGQWYLDTVQDAYFVWPYNNVDITLTTKNVITIMDWFPLADEIFQIWTDGSLKFRRLAHHRSGVWDYESSPRGAISPDGRYFVYTSNFDGMTNTDGTPRTDAFILVVPPLPVTPDTTAPSIPTNLTPAAISSTQINLSWTASTDNVGVTGYKIYRCAGSTCAPTTQIATSLTNSYSNTGLTASTTYTYAVSAYDAAGNESVKSSSVSATTSVPSDTTPPTISSVISTTLASTTARIDWTTNEPSTSQVEYGFTTQYGASTTLDATLTTSHAVLLSNLSPDNTTYNYRVRSKDSSGNEAISTNYTFITSGLTDIIPPASTTNLTANNITQTSVDLVWTAAGDDGNTGTAYQFDIRYATGELSENTWNNASVMRATGEPTPRIAGSVMNYTLLGLTPNTTYKVALKTLDEVPNQSPVSNIITFTTLQASLAPTPSPPSGGGFVTDTTPPSSPSSPKAVSADKQIILSWKNPPDTDFARVIVVRKEGEKPISREDGIIIYEGTQQELTDINLDNDKTYYYAIYAYDKKPNYSTPTIIQAKPEAGKISIPIERTIEQTLPYPNGSLLKTNDSDKIYVIVNNKKRWITNPEVFISYGFVPNSQIIVSPEILNQYQEEKELSKPSFKEGILIRAKNDFKVYIIKPPYKRHIFNPAIFNMYKHFSWNDIKEIDQDTLDSYITSDLYRAINDPKVFSLEEIDEAKGIAKKHWLNMSAQDFTLMGYNWNQVFVINPEERNYYQEGEEIGRTD